MTQQPIRKNRSAILVASALTAASLVGIALQPAWAGSAAEDRNKEIVLEYLDGLFNNGDAAIADALVSPDFVDHGNGTKEARNREDLKNEVVFYRKTFPDLNVEVSHIVAEDNLVTYRFVSRSSGTSIAPEGKPFFLTGIIIDRLDNGQIVERWENYDELGATKYFEPTSGETTSSVDNALPHKKAD